MKKIILLLVLIILSPAISSAAEYKFYAHASENPVTEGHKFQITFTIENASASDFQAPAFKGFELVGGPSQSSSRNIINGRISSQYSLSYVLQAKSIGTFTIPGGTATINGKKVKTNSLEIKVVEPSEQEKIQRQKKKEQEKEISEKAKEFFRKNLYMTLNVSKSDLYQGEQFVAEYKLYYHPYLRIQDYEKPQMPLLSGFWAEEVETDAKTTKEVVDGVLFNTVVLKKAILAPQKTGELELDPITMDFVLAYEVPRDAQTTRRRSNDPFDIFFDDPFFRRNQFKNFNYTVTSRTAKINVKPLPSDAPFSFDEAVGDFAMTAKFNKTKTKVSEPISLKVRITGEGNLKLIEPITLKLPSDMIAYDPKVDDNISVTAGGISGSKTFEYILTPQNPGEFDIDPIEYTYFDPDKKEYITLKSEPFHIVVEGEAGVTYKGAKQEEVKYGEEDIRFIKEETTLSRAGTHFFGSGVFIILSIIPLLAFIIFFAVRKKQEELNNNETLLKQKQATKIAKRRLSRAGIFLKNREQDKFFEEVSRALWGYLSDKLAIEMAKLNKDSAAEILLKKGIDDEKIIAYLSIIDNCEFARFAPMKDVSVEMEKTYKEAEKAITDIEEGLK